MRSSSGTGGQLMLPEFHGRPNYGSAVRLKWGFQRGVITRIGQFMLPEEDKLSVKAHSPQCASRTPDLRAPFAARGSDRPQNLNSIPTPAVHVTSVRPRFNRST